jgi:hypothetical protein
MQTLLVQLVSILVVLAIKCIIAQSVPFNYPTYCSSAYYFDSTSLQCVACPAQSTKLNTTSTCQCNSGYISVLSSTGSFTCTQCSALGFVNSIHF